jgi:hypothetical protein
MLSPNSALLDTVWLHLALSTIRNIPDTVQQCPLYTVVNHQYQQNGYIAITLIIEIGLND